MSEVSDICAICLDTLSSKQTFSLQCGHNFHTECQIMWFRNGRSTCPTCRSSHDNDTINHRIRRNNQTAFQIMSNRARRKDAPIPLKRAYEKYRKSLETQKDIKNKMRELTNSVGRYSDIKKQIRLLNKKKCKSWITSRRLYREISELCEIITVFSS